MKGTFTKIEHILEHKITYGTFNKIDHTADNNSNLKNFKLLKYIKICYLSLGEESENIPVVRKVYLKKFLIDH